MKIKWEGFNMKINKFIKGGSTPVLALCLLFLASYLAPAFGYAGIAKLKEDMLSGVETVHVFSGEKPNQKSEATSGDLVLLNKDDNYEIDDANDDTYRIYNIYDAPSKPVYLLLLKSDKYAILGAVPMGTTVPVTTPYDSAKFYKNGKPDAPSVLPFEVGYETAKAAWTLSSDYDYSQIEIEVATHSGFGSDDLLADSDNNTTTQSGKISEYKVGSLIDGRVLETNADGIKYFFRLRGKVAGVDPSVWMDSHFTTEGLGAVLPAAKLVKNWAFKKVPDKGGINTFAIPFISDNADKPIKKNDETLGDEEVQGVPQIKVRHIIKAIGTKVTSFGWWNELDQKHMGLVKVVFNENGTINAEESIATGGTVAEILNKPYVSDRPYQVSVKEDVDFGLEGYTQ